ncbi:hypothetical protein [Streptomyces sp. G1]|nr:hypothetical protein [Streptomyces sp. G1]
MAGQLFALRIRASGEVTPARRDTPPDAEAPEARATDTEETR